VKIDIPTVLVHMRGRALREAKAAPAAERATFRLVAEAFSSRRRYEAAQRLARIGSGPLKRLPVGPLSEWKKVRDLPEVPKQSFRDWWRERG
jgi:L-lactate dehydrogenase complex protein LldF